MCGFLLLQAEKSQCLGMILLVFIEITVHLPVYLKIKHLSCHCTHC